MLAIIFFNFPLLILFLFAVIAVVVLFLKLFIKKPWIAAIVALVLLLLGVFFVAMPQRHIVRHQVIRPMELVLPESREIKAAIWSPGIEDEFEADVYPSKISAVRSLGLRMDRPIQKVLGNLVSPVRIIVFQGAHNRQFLEEFGRAVKQVFPGTDWTIEPETVAVYDNDVAIRLDIVDVRTQPVPWKSSLESNVTSGRIEATAMAKSKSSTISASFAEKPWVDDFSGFLNNNPNDLFIIAKSSESCLTESEANRQAMENACTQVAQILKRNSDQLSAVPATLLSQVNPNDILEGGFILDRFVQSFEGAAGKIWRQALLVDASAGKLTQLARRKADMVRARKMSWARTFSSVVGLLVLITVVYVFLNAATKGYYVWSLRIAGIVLALIVIFLLLA
jgi:hypothetical protein